MEDVCLSTSQGTLTVRTITLLNMPLEKQAQRRTTAYPMDMQGKMRYKAVGHGRGLYPNLAQRVAAGYATTPRRRREQSMEGTTLHATDKVEIGRTGVHVTRLGLGGVALSGAQPATDPHQPTSEAEAIALIHRSLALGLNYLDTAPMYGVGDS